MKCAIVCAFLILCMVVAEVRSCALESDCRPDECCVVPVASARTGTCKKRATYRKPCIRKEKQDGGRYFRFCPCSDGMTCRMAEKLEAKYADVDIFFFLNKCYKTGDTTPKEVVIKDKKIPGGEIIEEDLQDR